MITTLLDNADNFLNGLLSVGKLTAGSVGRQLALKCGQKFKGIVEQLAVHLAEIKPCLSGFTRSNLYRMRQFYEAYVPYPIVSALLRQLSWMHHLSGRSPRQTTDPMLADWLRDP